MRAADRQRLAFLTDRPFAHRGLHGRGIPENSLAAARAAMDRGFGIECDVRLSRDGVAHVFHDRQLERLVGLSAQFATLDSAEIAALRLKRTDELIPRLSVLLGCIGRTSLLIEIKSSDGPAACARLCAAVAADIAGHESHVAVMSFDPLVCHWFARHHPEIVRGIVISRHYRAGIMSRRTKTLALARARPHFLACDVRDLPHAASRRLRPGGGPLLCWTVRSDAQRLLAARHGAQIIFEDPR